MVVDDEPRNRERRRDLVAVLDPGAGHHPVDSLHSFEAVGDPCAPLYIGDSSPSIAVTVALVGWVGSWRGPVQVVPSRRCSGNWVRESG